MENKDFAVIREDCGPHSGKRVEVHWNAIRYNPMTDELDENWVQITLPDGRIGSIEHKNLI